MIPNFHDLDRGSTIYDKLMENEVGKIMECIGCGYCCTKTKCGAGNRLYASADICPALKWTGERHICDLMELPGSLGETYREQLYAGAGCCSNLNSWRYEPLKDRTKGSIDPYVNPVPKIMQLFLGALGKQMISSDQISLTMNHLKQSLLKEDIIEEEVDHIIELCIQYISSQRSRFNSDFMG